VTGRPDRQPGEGWEANFQGLIELAPAYFYVASADDVAVTLYRSPQAKLTLGYDDEDWQANPSLWVSILHPDDRERVLAEFIAGVQGREPFRSLYRIFAKDGRVRWVRDHAAVVPNPFGPGSIVQGVVLDVTDQVESEQARMRAEVEREALSRLLSGMSHEFRTPLNSILGFAELLRSSGVDPLTARQERYLANIHVSGELLLGMINQLLDLTRIQAGHLQLEIAPVELGPAVERAVEAVRQTAAEKGLRVEMDVPSVRVEADARFLHQVLLNLLSQSAKSGAESVIGVTATVGEEDVSLRVTNDPGGSVAGGAAQDAATGPALGIQLARHLLEAMGGALTAGGTPGAAPVFAVRLRRAG
jgi:PAS domain S-box-containing protein